MPGNRKTQTQNKKPQNKKPPSKLGGFSGLEQQGKSGRGERIRTSGLYVPNVALYQAKLHPDLVLLDSYGVSVSFKTVLPSSKNIILAGSL